MYTKLSKSLKATSRKMHFYQVVLLSELCLLSKSTYSASCFKPNTQEISGKLLIKMQSEVETSSNEQF